MICIFFSLLNRDWYNLEKSKRVKAFRCGEFDACIERAEASQSVPSKKREKYARREDAILHALELEKKQLERKHQRQGVISNGMAEKTSSALRREISSFSASEQYLKNEEPGLINKFAGHKSHKLSRKPSWSLAEENMGHNIDGYKRISKQFKQEEDTLDVIPRTRELQDFGLPISLKKKLSPTVSWETSGRLIDNYLGEFPNDEHIFESTIPTSAGKNILSVKRKRSQGIMVEESLVKKRDRRRPLNKVLQSSAKLSVPHSFLHDQDSGVGSIQGEKDPMGFVYRAKRSRCIYLPSDANDSLDPDGFPSEEMAITGTQYMNTDLDLPGNLSEEHRFAGLIGNNESDSSGREYSETNTEKETDILEDTSQTLAQESEACDPSVLQALENFRNTDNDEVPLSSFIRQLNPHEDPADASAEVGVSKWHMKGKRNNRSISKRPVDVTDERIRAGNCNGSTRGDEYQIMESTSKVENIEHTCQKSFGRELCQKKGEVDYDCNELELTEDTGHPEMIRYGGQKCAAVLKTSRDHGRSRISFDESENDPPVASPLGWVTDGPSHNPRKAYRKESGCYHPDYAAHLSGQVGPLLIDVDLKVQASYQGERVPLVSLMSRLNGKAIIGHPIQIEILEDGSVGQLLSSNDGSLGKSTASQPVWRTGRRTAMQRVPRPNPATSTLESDDDDGTLLHLEREIKSPLKKYSGHFNHQARMVKKSISHARRPISGRFQKKPFKRVNLSSQKIRTLSSFATEKRLGGENGKAKLARSSGILGRLIKPEGAVPLVTCVPVKVVFSRILEAVGRPSLIVSHRVRMASLAVRDSS
ncbi:uncharacterized protein At1g51745-like isoform X2 [Typha angustifolia]|uniref:uncharacterized protein At1g51745-like isoform X2 n=1 Tax=Typha angustifolia TaxID=59011 RepID=UPI003C2E5E9C